MKHQKGSAVFASCMSTSVPKSSCLLTFRTPQHHPYRNHVQDYHCNPGGGVYVRKTQEGCGSLGGENPGALPKAGPIFQQTFSLPENAQTLAGIAFGAARKSVKNFPAALTFAGKLFQQGISDSHSLLEFSEYVLP